MCCSFRGESSIPRCTNGYLQRTTSVLRNRHCHDPGVVFAKSKVRGYEAIGCAPSLAGQTTSIEESCICFFCVLPRRHHLLAASGGEIDFKLSARSQPPQVIRRHRKTSQDQMHQRADETQRQRDQRNAPPGGQRNAPPGDHRNATPRLDRANKLRL